MKRPQSAAFLAIGTTVSVLLATVASPVKANDAHITLDGSLIYEQLDTTDDYLVDDNSYFDTYTFTGRAGQRVVIAMSSQQIDSYLILLDPDGNSLLQDDDGGGNLDARIEVVLPVDGVYTIYANSYSGGAIGSYTLQASTLSNPSPTAVNPPQPSPEPNNAPVAALPRYFCDSSSDIPFTMARSRRSGDTFPLIQWTSDWAPAPYTPDERCHTVTARLNDVHDRFDRLILTAGTWNNQPVVCAANSSQEARQGICAADGLVLTTQYRTDAEDLIRGLQTSFTRIVAGTSPDILPASSSLDNGSTPYIDISDF